MEEEADTYDDGMAGWGDGMGLKDGIGKRLEDGGQV